MKIAVMAASVVVVYFGARLAAAKGVTIEPGAVLKPYENGS